MVQVKDATQLAPLLALKTVSTPKAEFVAELGAKALNAGISLRAMQPLVSDGWIREGKHELRMTRRTPRRGKEFLVQSPRVVEW